MTMEKCGRKNLVLYAFRLPKEVPFEDYQLLLELLSPDERARVQRYRLEDDRLRSLVSRISLWFHLLRHERVDRAHRPAFASGHKGKPYLLGGEDVGFNVSHEGKWVLMGVGKGAEVGVDVMVPPSDPVELKEALIPQMTIQERLALSIPLSNSRLRWTLSALWALKEGYTKAVGEGVGFGLERINVVFGKGASMSTGLTVTEVQVDGRDVRDNGWKWTIGTVGVRDTMEEVGYAMYWKGFGVDAPEIEVIEWQELMRTFDNVPPFRRLA